MKLCLFLNTTSDILSQTLDNHNWDRLGRWDTWNFPDGPLLKNKFL